MAIPIGSCEDWHRDCEVDVRDIITFDASNPCHSKVLSKLCSKTTGTLKELPMSYPTISMDDDVVYLLSRTRSRDMGKLNVCY